jgi:hypothetical protein
MKTISCESAASACRTLATIKHPLTASQSNERFFAVHSGIAMQEAPAALPGGAPRLMAPMSNGKSKYADGGLSRVSFEVQANHAVGEGRKGK